MPRTSQPARCDALAATCQSQCHSSTDSQPGERGQLAARRPHGGPAHPAAAAPPARPARHKRAGPVISRHTCAPLCRFQPISQQGTHSGPSYPTQWQQSERRAQLCRRCPAPAAWPRPRLSLVRRGGGMGGPLWWAAAEMLIPCVLRPLQAPAWAPGGASRRWCGRSR